MYKDLPVYHEAIYIQIDTEGGNLYQVNGSLKFGFHYETGRTDRPENSKRFYKKFLKGTVARDKLNRVVKSCRSVRIPRLEY